MPASPTLSSEDLAALLRRVFLPRDEDRGVAILVDLPDAEVPDEASWRARRRLAADWTVRLAGSDLGLSTRLFGYRNVRRNNADLPPRAWALSPEALPSTADDLAEDEAMAFADVFRDHTIVLAPTRFSATAPLKLAAPRYRIRAATMPGFSPAMIPALKLDYGEVDRRCRKLKELLDQAQEAAFVFEAGGRTHELLLDLRFREAHASSGLLREPGTAGNLPSGETYIVPYEGERPGEPSRSTGTLPVELDGEILLYRVEENRAVGVEGLEGGEVARREAETLRREPAYGNLAELGLGVLAEMGVGPIGELLLDEKLGLHIAFGRSDHFGGRIGAADFSRPESVVHIDRVYLPQTQPRIRVRRVDLKLDGEAFPLMRDGRYVEAIAGAAS